VYLQRQERQHLVAGPSAAVVSADETSGGGVVPGLTLRRAVVLFRHGARAPLYPWPTSTGSGIYGMWPVSLMHIAGPGHARMELKPRCGVWKSSAMDERQLATILPGGCPAAQLTTVGRDQALALGARLRERYVVQHKLVGLAGYVGTLAWSVSAAASSIVPIIVRQMGGVWWPSHSRACSK
jgi:hypothetical protein